MSNTTLGTLIGLALGAVIAFGTFGQMLIVALFGAIGFVIAKVVAGELDLSQYVGGRREPR